MTRGLAGVLETYRQGIERELLLLGSLARLSSSQRAASLDRDLAHVEALTVERADLFQELMQLEDELCGPRGELAAQLDVARTLDGFEAVKDLHQQAARHLDALLRSDRETCAALECDSSLRRLAVQELEAGEATLAAYRKVLSPATPRSGIFDRRG